MSETRKVATGKLGAMGFLILGAAIGCGSSNGNGGSGGTAGTAGTANSGLPATTIVAALTDAQLGTLCDALAMPAGGYGKSATCGDAGETQSDGMNQADCVSQLRTFGSVCPTATVSDAEGCANAKGKDLCSFDTVAGCATIRACLADT
jgi:hypothetical protein